MQKKIKHEIKVTESEDGYTFSRKDGHGKDVFICMMSKNWATKENAMRLFQNIYMRMEEVFEHDVLLKNLYDERK